jgi:hypothetical protein
MLKWNAKHPKARLDMLGYLPSMISEDNPQPAREQFDHNYRHGGGWRPFKGHEMLPSGDMKYPGDPPTRLLYEVQLRDETIRFYEDAWVAVIQPSGEFEVCRMD